MIIIGKELIKELKNGVRIMSVEARYLYSACKDENNLVGYNTTQFWVAGKKKLPYKLYGVKMPYSLCLEKMYDLNPSEFLKDDYGMIYTDMIINVSFKGAAKKPKVGKMKKDGSCRNITPKLIIKSHGTGKNELLTIKKVERLEVEKNREKLREHMYKQGFTLNGNKYVCFMRSTSKSRGGNMLFIKEEYLLNLLVKWARLGIEILKDWEIDVAGIKAHESLVLSGICGKLEIKPNEILLIRDYDSIFSKKASVTELDENNRLQVKDKEIEYKNSIWDGMSLMDSSKYKEFIEFDDVSEHATLNGKSFVLLRNLWFKSAAFNFDIQGYFRDNDITIEDVRKHGWTIAENVKDIKLIITPNSLKILKIKHFVENVHEDLPDGQVLSMFEYWLKYIKENSYFGVVKSEHGMYDHARRCNAQFLMALPLSKEDINNLLECGEFPYMAAMRNDNEMFLMHIGGRSDDTNMMIYELASYAPEIMKTEMFKEFKNNTLNDYKENWKKDGIKIPNSDFCVCVSNPIEMIQYACGVDSKEWVRIHNGREAYCKFYDEGQEVMAARNPCVSSGNIICLKNKQHELLDKYMVLSNNIVVVNSIESDIMERASGMDYDSDQMWLSSNEILVEKAKFCEENFLTPVNKVRQHNEKAKYNVISDLAETDHQISKGKVGDIVNMGQILQAYYWHIYFSFEPKDDKEEKEKQLVLKKLFDKISILSSASNVEIDRAKREFQMDTVKELNELREIGMTESELKGFINYEKSSNLKKDTITQEELEANKEIKSAYEKIEELNKLEVLTEGEKNERNAKYQLINHYLQSDHKKDESKIKEKIKKPLYFKYQFPSSVKSSVYFEDGMNCPMDNLCMIVDEKTPKKSTRDKGKTNIMDLLNKYPTRSNEEHRKKIIEITKDYSKFCKEKKFYQGKAGDSIVSLSKKDKFEQCVEDIKKINLTHSTIVSIFNACYGSNQAKSHNQDVSGIKKHMLDLIYAAHRDKVLECFKGREVFGQRYFKKMYLIPINK